MSLYSLLLSAFYNDNGRTRCKPRAPELAAPAAGFRLGFDSIYGETSFRNALALELHDLAIER